MPVGIDFGKKKEGVVPGLTPQIGEPEGESEDRDQDEGSRVESASSGDFPGR